MSSSVYLRNGKSFTCEPDESILDAAKRQSLILEYSCTTGQCGICKAKLKSGETLVLHKEDALSEDDLSAGLILTCCRSATSNSVLDIEDISLFAEFPVMTLPCRIESLEFLEKDIVQVVLRFPPASKLGFLPGQYVNVIGKNGLRRSYSIANAPREDGNVTLQIRRVKEGAMSQYWFEEAKLNDLLRVEGPMGTFCLRKTDSDRLILLATGTGIAPIKAILEQLENTFEALPFKSIHLYWGGRYQKDIYWNPSFSNLPLKFIPVLSRENNWEGCNGYVQNQVLLDKLQLSNAVVYACGSEKMINSSFLLLTDAELPENNFYSDAFVSTY